MGNLLYKDFHGRFGVTDRRVVSRGYLVVTREGRKVPTPRAITVYSAIVLADINQIHGGEIKTQDFEVAH